MGLFYRKSDAGTHMPLYTTGASKTILVVGLGNIGSNYVKTRHNIGFMCADYYAQSQGFSTWAEKKDHKCFYANAVIGGTRIVLIKPTTLMNLSGDAVQAAAHFYKVEPKNILVVHDELDIDFGKIRTSTSGSAAGHNGIKSIIAAMGQDFNRVRVGIGPKTPPQMDSADYVLAKFTSEQLQIIPDIIKEVANIISDFSASDNLFVETRSVII